MSIGHAESPAPGKVLHLEIGQVPKRYATLFDALKQDLWSKTCWRVNSAGHAHRGPYEKDCVAFVEFHRRRWERIRTDRKYRISVVDGSSQLRLELFRLDGKEPLRVGMSDFPSELLVPEKLRDTVVGWALK